MLYMCTPCYTAQVQPLVLRLESSPELASTQPLRLSIEVLHLPTVPLQITGTLRVSTQLLKGLLSKWERIRVTELHYNSRTVRPNCHVTITNTPLDGF